MVDTEVSTEDLRGVFKSDLFRKSSPNFLFKVGRCNKDEVVDVDGDFAFVLFMVEEARVPSKVSKPRERMILWSFLSQIAPLSGCP